jgi:hypothetical protein
MFATNWAISGWRLIDGVKRAIDKAGHPTAYILSPGNDATLAQGENVSRVADAFRITPDWFVCQPIHAHVKLDLRVLNHVRILEGLCPCRVHSAGSVDFSECFMREQARLRKWDVGHCVRQPDFTF